MPQSPGGRWRAARPVFLLAALLLALALRAEAQVTRRTFNWDYAGVRWSLSYDFPSALIEFQRSLPRNLDYSSYGAYVDDPRDDAALAGFVAELERLALGLSAWERLNLMLALIQSIPYVEESREYPRYPLETLVDQQADCEDTAILAAALVRLMGFDAVLLAYLPEKHMAVGIRVLPPQHQARQAYEHNGELYFYLETSSPGWEIGQLPPGYASYPVVIGLQPIRLASAR